MNYTKLALTTNNSINIDLWSIGSNHSPTNTSLYNSNRYSNVDISNANYILMNFVSVDGSNTYTITLS